LQIEIYIKNQDKYVLPSLFYFTATALLIVIIYLWQTHTSSIELITLFKMSFLFLIVYCAIASGLIHFYNTPLVNYLLIAGLGSFMVYGYVNFERIMQNDYSQIALANYIKTHDAKRPVYLFRDYEKLSSLVFYLQRRLPIVDSVSQDLYFGSHTPA